MLFAEEIILIGEDKKNIALSDAGKLDFKIF